MTALDEDASANEQRLDNLVCRFLVQDEHVGARTLQTLLPALEAPRPAVYTIGVRVLVYAHEAEKRGAGVSAVSGERSCGGIVVGRKAVRA